MIKIDDISVLLILFAVFDCCKLVPNRRQLADMRLILSEMNDGLLMRVHFQLKASERM